MVQQEQDDKSHPEITGLTSRNANKTLEEMLVAIGVSLSDLSVSDNGEYGDDEDDQETEQGKLSEDDEPGCVMGTIITTVQKRMDRFPHNQMKLDEIYRPQSGDEMEYLLE